MNVKPTEKIKKRYIALRLESEKEIPANLVEYNIYKSILEFLGEYGYSLANPKLIKYNKSIGIIRCNVNEVEKVKAALVLTSQINNIRVSIHTLGVSGTLNKLRTKKKI
ncbi:ribonuclease P protein component 2 [Candidatus Micrarchaeota archaeon]|nr:ribonuclease P protein component 2 [Candidatus Micrarchaeota archaeon]